jgi:hypothetical protein
MTPQSGLLLHWTIEKAMDDGAIIVVPDITQDHTPAEVQLLKTSEPKNYPCST